MAAHRRLLIRLVVVGLLLSLSALLAPTQRGSAQTAACALPPQTTSPALYYTRSGDTMPLGQLTLSPGEQVPVLLCLNTGPTNVNGFDVTLDFGSGLTINSIADGADVHRFNTEVFKTIDNQSHTFRFTKVSTDLNAAIPSRLHLATLLFSAGSVGAGGRLALVKALITSPASDTALTVARQPVDYAVGSVTNVVPNASFEDGSGSPSGWSYLYDDRIPINPSALETVTSHLLSRSLSVTNIGFKDPDHQSLNGIFASTVPIEGSKTYVLWFWAKVREPSGYCVVMGLFPTYPVDARESFVKVQPSIEWQRYEHRFVMPSGASRARFAIWGACDGGSEGASKIYIDDIGLAVVP